MVLAATHDNAGDLDRQHHPLRSYFCNWHKVGVPTHSTDVRYRGQTGRDAEKFEPLFKQKVAEAQNRVLVKQADVKRKVVTLLAPAAARLAKTATLKAGLYAKLRATGIKNPEQALLRALSAHAQDCLHQTGYEVAAPLSTAPPSLPPAYAAEFSAKVAIAKHAEMIGRDVEAIAAVEDNGALLRLEIAAGKDVVDPLVSGGRRIDKRIFARPSEAGIVRMAFGIDIVKSFAAV